ncbi:lipase 1-like [Plodia interpunctella]|uniref:lipase 1-like n=1 Tax=Plodia interpunctella TaxID=58824 RepID=UPI00236875B1|nr:lipase 1-like [Plodia interpunctella]
MIYKTIALILMSLSSAWSDDLNEVPEDGRLNFTGLALKYVGRAESVQSSADGYQLTLHRVRGHAARPVLVVHGLMGSSSEFLMQGRDSIVHALAAAGHDVWLANYRGNRYSRAHVALNPDGDRDFWQFGPHQHACADLAAFIDTVLNRTGQTQLSLIAHSEGTSITYILGSERPEYNDKIKIFIALAPCMHLHYITKTLPPPLLSIAKKILTTFKRLGIEEVGGYDGIRGTMLRKFCAHTLIGRQVCRQLMLAINGYDAEGMETDFMPTLFWNYPAGSSRMNLEHEFQWITSKRFAKFDYGPKVNMEKYGSEIPPLYDIKKFTMKTFIFAAKNDRLAVLEDTRRQAEELPNVVEYKLVDDELFNHVDFVWTRRTREIQPTILEVLDKYN